MLEIVRYQRLDGREPFSQWLTSLKDKTAQARVRVRLRQLESGNFGDVQPIGGGLSELRIHVGAGYRVYFGQQGRTLIVLLCGGSKSSQDADIAAARKFWLDWKQRQA